MNLLNHLKRKMKIVIKVLKREKNMKYLALTSNSQNYICFLCGISLSPPLSEENLIGKWHTIIFDGEKIPDLFIARFDQCFLQDENGPLAAIDCFCLKEKIGYDNNNSLEEDKINKKDTIAASNIICGPLTCSFNERWKRLVKQYCEVKKFFDVVKNLDRK